MGKQGFEEFRQTLINQNVFKKIKKESVLDCKNILKILYETKNKMRAKEIQESIQRDIKITSLNARLKLLEMR
jgi:CRISPR/Cas system-associated endonuclease Cas1